MIQIWIWGVDLELHAWIFELEGSILNLKIRSWTSGCCFQHENWIFNLRIQTWTPGFEFWTWGFNFEHDYLLLNSELQFWTWGYNFAIEDLLLELRASILNSRVQFWSWGFAWSPELVCLAVVEKAKNCCWSRWPRCGLVVWWLCGFKEKNIINLILAAEASGQAVVWSSGGLVVPKRKA